MRKPQYTNATNLTNYARAIGYTGTRDVLVLDGKVVSHGNKDWFEFCDKCRESSVKVKASQSLTQGASA